MYLETLQRFASQQGCSRSSGGLAARRTSTLPAPPCLLTTPFPERLGQISRQSPSVASLQGEAPRRREIGYGPSHFMGAEGPGVENDPMPWAI